MTCFCTVALGCSGACSGSAMVLRAGGKMLFTPLPLRDVNFLPAYTVVEHSPMCNSLQTENYCNQTIKDKRNYGCFIHAHCVFE